MEGISLRYFLPALLFEVTEHGHFNSWAEIKHLNTSAKTWGSAKISFKDFSAEESLMTTELSEWEAVPICYQPDADCYMQIKTQGIIIWKLL